MPTSEPTSPGAVVADYESARSLDPWLKGLPTRQPRDPSPTPTSIAASGGHLFDIAVRTPFAVLRSSAVTTNIEEMARFCAEHSLSLAPHAKTTMSPQLVGEQLSAGAWAATAALPVQVERLWDFGVGRVLLANEVADPTAMGRLGAGLDADRRRALLCFVDSPAGVALAENGLRDAATTVPVEVLVDVGHAHGRTGARSREQVVDVARAVARAPHLRLTGVGGYEGTISSVRDDTSTQQVDRYLTTLRETLAELLAMGLVDTAHPVVSAGGSIWFDRVAAVLGPLAVDGTTRVVTRSGCYVTHDHGMYADAAPRRGADSDSMLPTFRPALEVWARVVSRPEPGLAIVDAGRRDLSHDAGLPRPLTARRPDGRQVDLGTATVGSLSDQHAFVTVAAQSTLAVGDLVGLGISHPCTTFDRWPLLLRVDDDDRVVGVVRTYF